MRCLAVCVLAVMWSLPLSAGAQDEGSMPDVREPQSETAQEAPALQLELDDAGVDVVPSPARTADGYTLREMERRAQRAKRGLGVAVVPVVAGGVMMIAGTWGSKCGFVAQTSAGCQRLLYGGAGVAAVGAAGMIATGILLGVRKKKLRALREAAQYERRRRVQWDLARSRLVF
ncbi:MAG: hypothetical protein HKN97_14490 [Myxococcales bacterium]|nr:hypothetical protein [Myxococcales bacterium]